MIYTRALKTLNYHARWNNLRAIGNSSIAKASIVVPILGYLVLFNTDIIAYLKIHSSFCKDCNVSWRLYFFYFGSFFFALGSFAYGLRCPSLIKTYPGATDFFEAEKNYFCNPSNLSYLFDLIANEKGAPANDPHNLSRNADFGDALANNELVYLAGIMGELYVIRNFSHIAVRACVLLSFSIGTLLLAIPSLVTFGQVLTRALQLTLGV